MIYHWCQREEWEADAGRYAPASLEQEGFIHFSFRGQVERTATAFNHGMQGLVLVAADGEGLNIVVEDSYGVGEEFPHCYEPLPKAMAKSVVDFPPEVDGSFRLPSGTP